MTAILPVPLYLKDCAIEIGTDEYAAAINSATLTPNVSIARFVGLTPTADYKDADIDWTLDLTYVQDWDTTASLARKLWDAQGTVIEGCTFKPKSANDPEFTVDLFIVPGSVGGQARAHSTSQVQLQVVGQPTFTDPA